MNWKRSIRECVPHTFYCTKCGNRGIPIMRMAKQLRPHAHKKRLYCVHCKRVTNHIEMKFYDKVRLGVELCGSGTQN